MTEEERDEMMRSNWKAQMAFLGYGPDGLALPQKKTSGWISVKDRLPEKDGLYLVYGMSEAMRELLPDCVPIWLCYWRRKYEGWYDIEMCRGYDFITHWMPLPEPPKEAE